MLYLIASSCRLVELDQLFLIPLSGDEEETFKGNWKGLCVCARVCVHACVSMCVRACVCMKLLILFSEVREHSTY